MSPIRTVEADLSTLGVELPRTHTGMVLAQPHLDLTPQEPYRCTDMSKQRQLATIQATLVVAGTTCHGAAKTHFTIFPEYSIPAPEGIDLVEDALRRPGWPAQTIIIGGTDGLSAREYTQLVAAPGTHVDMAHNDPARIPAGQWINCAIIWAKGANGTVERWLQPKLYPSWPEEDVADGTMFRGNSIFAFKGRFDDNTQYRFSVLVCFDWIASVEHQRPWRAMVDELSRQATAQDAEFPLSWMIVIQHNRKPSHESFMIEVNEFFNNTIATNVRRDRACLVFANSAGQPTPGRIQHHGNTSVIFAQQTLFEMPKCHGTFCSGGPQVRGHGVISHHKDCLFRERGACVHAFRLVNPDSLVAGAARRTIPLSKPSVHPLGDRWDPRTPGDVVPGSVKWLNDELDTIQSLTSVAPEYREVPLAEAVDVAYELITDGLREASPASAGTVVRLASPTVTRHPGNGEAEDDPSADHWGAAERTSVTHLVHTISILRVCSDGCAVADTSVHATLSIGGRELDVVAVCGETHEACRNHYIGELPAGRRPVLLVSRDVDNNERLQRFGPYVETATEGPERNFTDPEELSCQLGYRDLLSVYLASNNADEAKERLNDKLAR